MEPESVESGEVESSATPSLLEQFAQVELPDSEDSGSEISADSVEDSEATGEEPTPSEPEDPFEAYLKELETDQEADEPEDDDALEDAEALRELANNPKSRARKRIQKLATQRKEAEQSRIAAENRAQELQSLVEKQAKLLQAQLGQQIQARQPTQPQVHPQAQANDPFAELLGHLTPQLEERVNAAVKPLQEKLTAYEQREQQVKEQQAYQQRVQQIEQEAAGVRHMLVPGLPEELQNSPEVASALDEFLIIKAVAENKPVSQVLPQARKAVAQIARAMTAAARERGKSVAQSAAQPKVALKGVAPVKERTSGVPMYSLQQIQEAGYKDRPTAWRDGFKRLSKIQPAEGYSQ